MDLSTTTMIIAMIGVVLNFIIAYNTQNDLYYMVVVFVICSLSLAFFWMCLMTFYVVPMIEPHTTGEIIKFYANGTVLVDNGTVMPWPYGGCGK